jgi:hypothetical protein
VSANLLLAVCIASPLLFTAMLWLTRAGPRRATAALAACAAAAVFSLCWDALAASMGWWTYPTSGEFLPTLALALACGFGFGGAAALLGWRMIRSGGWFGAATFLAAFVGIGMLRDYMLDINTTEFSFGPGLAPHLMAGVGYLSMAIIAQVVMLLMAGPPRADALRTN